MDERLKKIYYDERNEGSFGGVESLLRAARKAGVPVSRAGVKAFLTKQDAYTLHKPARRRYPRGKIIVGAIDKQWQADLADMNDVVKDNDGYRYLLTVIDCFSKFAWVVPVKTKFGESLLVAFKQLLKESAPRKPKRLQTDKGKEFFNTKVSGYLAEQGIAHFASNSDQKAAMVERFNRTLKTRIWRYFTANNTNRYLDVLPKIVTSYNKSFHRTIGMAPKDVRKEHELRLWQRMYPEYRPIIKKPLETDTSVRISKVKQTFEKGYLPNWTEEAFTVASSLAKRPRVYKLKDSMGEPVEGVFYEQEIQPILKDKQTLYLIEKVIRKRKLRGQTELLVKWKGYPEKFNSWVKEADVQDKDVTRRE